MASPSPSWLGLTLRVVTAVVMLLSCTPTAGAAEAAPRVVYAPPLLTVSAREVALPVLLRAIGRAVGFEIVDETKTARAAVSIDVRDATLDDVLRQVLRNEDHVVAYVGDPSASRVDVIVLRGPYGQAARVPPVPGTAASRGGVDSPSNVPSTVVEVVPPTVAPLPAAPPPAGGVTPPVASPQRDDAATATAPRGAAAGSRVDSLLSTHASPQPPPAPAAPARYDSRMALPRDLAADLARMTRAAQQDVRSLTEGLDAAAQSMRDADAVPAR